MNRLSGALLNLINGLGKQTGDILAAILPARCPVSGEMVPTPGLLAPSVWQQLDFVDRPFCACCGLRFEVPVEGDEDRCPRCLEAPPHFKVARSALVYDDQSREMILSFKHGDQTHLAVTFGPWMARVAEAFRGEMDVVMPVPLHRLRLWVRRYNQAALLAQYLAHALEKPFMTGVLTRVKRTPSQGRLTRVERLRNVAGAFRVPKDQRGRLKGLRILLVDDVYTTGATVNACARALRRAGAEAVYVVTLARVMRPVMIDPKERWGAAEAKSKGGDEGLLEG